MARPVGRYFASVIAKIRDAKKKETIVVDEGFKMQLRQQLMMKIAAQTAPARTSWVERLAPFKSYLGVVPALALVIVAVVGISKLPIDFGSKVIVPTSTPSQQSNETQPLAVIMSPGNEATASTGGIKTFPGRLVLPPSYFKGGESVGNVDQPLPVQSLEANTFGEESIQASQPMGGNEQKTTLSPVTEQQPQVEQQQPQQSVPFFQQFFPKQQPVQYFSYQNQPANPNARIGEGNVQTSLPPVQQNQTSAPVLPSVSGSTPAVSTSTGTADNAGASSVSGAVPLSVTGQPASLSADAVKVQKSAESVVAQPAPSAPPAIVAKPKALEMQKAANAEAATAAPSLNDIATMPAQHLGLNVLYDGNFSGDERTILEKIILPHLAEGKDIDYINVSQKDAATIVIELHLKNGSVMAFDYKVTEQGTLELVQSSSNRAAQQF